MSAFTLSARVLQLFSVAWQFLTFSFMILLYPQSEATIGVVAIVIGVSLGTAGVLRRSSLWINFSMLTMWTIFFLLVISQAVSGLVAQYLPFTLLQFVMILFAFEVLTMSCKLSNWVSTEAGTITIDSVEHRFDASRHVFGRISRIGLVLATGYVLSLAILYLGALVASAVPILADISLYIVVVSVSLALLLLFREE